jgi:hypothetical protein
MRRNAVAKLSGTTLDHDLPSGDILDATAMRVDMNCHA